MTVLVAFCRSGLTAAVTAAAKGGEASPVLDPASITAPASQGAEGAAAMPAMPAAAIRAATMATARGPTRSVRKADSAIAMQ
ncbi:hypothetical protein D3C72_802130 [compost metagenome]